MNKVIRVHEGKIETDVMVDSIEFVSDNKIYLTSGKLLFVEESLYQLRKLIGYEIKWDYVSLSSFRS